LTPLLSVSMFKAEVEILCFVFQNVRETTAPCECASSSVMFHHLTLGFHPQTLKLEQL